LQDYRYGLDRLTIERTVNGNTHTFLDDTFDNNNASLGPNFFNSGVANYGISAPVFENNGHAFFDGTAAQPLTNIFLGPQRVGQNMTLLTDTVSNPNAGLKKHMDFTVDARFDLVLPQDNLEQYGIRLLDSAETAGDSTVSLTIRREPGDGVVYVILQQLSFVQDPETGLGTATILQRIELNPGAWRHADRAAARACGQYRNRHRVLRPA